MSGRKPGGPAYMYVDLSSLSQEAREPVVTDANMGGHQYGVRVVEEVVRGPSRVPIYGVYYDVNGSDDEERWAAYQAAIGTDVVETDVADVLDAARAQAEAEAEALREAEDAALALVTDNKLKQ